MSEALRHRVERFDRFQRQFARARRRRERDEFARSLDELVARAAKPRPSPTPTPTTYGPVDGREEYDQEMRDLLVRVASRDPVHFAPDSLSPTTDWWSPTPVYGFRVWQLLGGGLHGAKMMWAEPQLEAVCLHPTTDPQAPLPHDVAECGRPPCGIYATKTPEQILEEIGEWFGEDPLTLAIGVVALTGRVVEHERGYRAQHARVAAVAVVAGDRSTCTTTWVDAPHHLAALFSSPESYLASAPGRQGETAAALRQASLRLAEVGAPPAA